MAGKFSLDAKQHTLQPIVTGATVIAVKYNGGVMIAADTLASYGSQARYKDMNRLKKVGKYSILGASGEMSDFQYIGDRLDELDNEEYCDDDGCVMGPKQYASYVGRVMYNRRSKFNPLYNQFVLVGKKGEEAPFLAYCDHQGTYYEEDYIATGFGSYLAAPLLFNEADGKSNTMTAEEAKALIVKCLQVCFYRDCRAYYKIRIGNVDKDGVTISEPYAMDHNWSHPAWLENRLTGPTARGISDTW